MKTTRTLAATVATLAVLTACTAGDGPEDEATPSPSLTEEVGPDDEPAPVVEPAWSLPLDVIGQPDVLDGVAVVLTRARDRAVDVVAVDVATGEQLWSRPWSPGGGPVGIALTPSVSRVGEDLAVVAFSEPPADLSTAATTDYGWVEPVVAVDARTGEELLRSDPVRVNGWVGDCEDDENVCFTVGSGGMIMAIPQGWVGPDASGPPPGTRSIGPGGLFSTNDRPGERLGVSTAGMLAWQKPVEDVMGTGVSSDQGWHFELVDGSDGGTLVGQMSLPLDAATLETARAGEPYDGPAGDQRLVGLHALTGEVFWTVDHAEHDCFDVAGDDAPLMVRCVYEGTLTRNTDDPDLSGISVRVEGFEPRSGDVVWSHDLSPDGVRALVNDEGSLVTDGSEVVLDTVDGRLRVDVATGDTEPVGDDDVFACASERLTVEYLAPWLSQGRAITERRGGTLRTPCTADGSAADGWTTDAARHGGVVDGGVAVMAVEGALQGFALD